MTRNVKLAEENNVGWWCSVVALMHLYTMDSVVLGLDAQANLPNQIMKLSPKKKGSHAKGNKPSCFGFKQQKTFPRHIKL